MDTNISMGDYFLHTRLIRSVIVSRTMRMRRQRQRQVNDAIRLQKRKRLLFEQEQWQATQIQIWHRMNDEALLNEKRLKNVSQPIDKPEVKLI